MNAWIGRSTAVSLASLLSVSLISGFAAACASGGGGGARSTSSAGAAMDDSTIATRVRTALLNEADLGALRIDVQVENGVVTLGGAVKTKPEEDKALAVARTIGGVRSVHSALKVDGGGGS